MLTRNGTPRCSAAAWCERGDSCVNGLCPGVKVGDACPSGACLDGLRCTDAGVCEPRGLSGAPCTQANDCVSLECVNGACSVPNFCPGL